MLLSATYRCLGWHGLAMAKTYTELYPEEQVILLDSSSSIGGVWAKERLYPGLKTNNLLGSYEFSDFPMYTEKFGAIEGQHIPGVVVHEYLTQFASHFNLLHRIRLQHVVKSAELQDDGNWLLSVQRYYPEDSGCTEEVQLTTKRLVLATGLTSEPFVPEFVGKEIFNRLIMHSRELKQRTQDLASAKQVVVMGGNKSAWDTCYSAAMAGASVHMLMRPSGGGPSWVWPLEFSPLKLSIQRLATTRFFTLFDPCIWSSSDGFSWLRDLLHRTWIGHILVVMFWRIIANFVFAANRYDDHPEMRKLKPWTSTYWMGNSLGINNYETNWFDLVRNGRIKVRVADVVSLSEGAVHLSDGGVLPTDALVCCTGWKVVPPIRFLPLGIEKTMGFPSESLKTENEALVANVRAQILAAAPKLRHGPKRSLPPISGTQLYGWRSSPEVPERTKPYRLYRFLVPHEERFLKHHNFAFLGCHLAINAVMVAQAQALWVTAFFKDEIDGLKYGCIDLERVEYECILHTEYERLRHPPSAGGSGERCPDLVFDGMLYIDLLFKDLGVRHLRKRSLLSELFGRYMPVDYVGLPNEWAARRRTLTERTSWRK